MRGKEKVPSSSLGDIAVLIGAAMFRGIPEKLCRSVRVKERRNLQKSAGDGRSTQTAF